MSKTGCVHTSNNGHLGPWTYQTLGTSQYLCNFFILFYFILFLLLLLLLFYLFIYFFLGGGGGGVIQLHLTQEILISYNSA